MSPVALPQRLRLLVGVALLAYGSPGWPQTNLITNGSFDAALDGWSVWTERGSLTPQVVSRQLHLQSVNHNGGVYQRFNTGGAGTILTPDGLWASDPTVPQGQWAEVLIINGSRLPRDGQEVAAGQSDVVLVYKNDTWASPGGWSGAMAATSPVAQQRSFVAGGPVATIVLKSGNLGGVVTGVRFDEVSVVASGGPPPDLNLLTNPDLEDGYYHWRDVPEIAIPNGWNFDHQTAQDPKLPRQDDPFYPPECVVWNIADAPPEERSQFFLSGDHTLKIFKGWGPIWWRLFENVGNLTAGQGYRLTVPIFPDLVSRYDEQGKKVFADDPLAGEVRLSVKPGAPEVETGWLDGTRFPFGQYTSFTLDFVAEAATVEVSVEARGRWGLLNNGWFIDALRLVPIEPSNAAIISRGESVVPASVGAAGTQEVTIRVQNTGSTTWTAAELYRLGATSSNQFLFDALPGGGHSPSPTDGRVLLCPGDAITPGQSHDFRFRIRPTAASGAQVLSLQMVRDGVAWFGNAESWTIAIEPTVSPPSGQLIQNGDFSNGLTGWTLWNERGQVSASITNGQLHLQSANHNGGVYQRFDTGGPGRRISISGTWASDPTMPANQWAEVLVVNGDRIPVDGQDVHGGQSDVALVYKNDTWASPGGWSGPLAQTAPVANAGQFVSAGSSATLVLKSGNMGGVVTGARFDDVGALADSAPANRPPTAVVSADPTSGTAPLIVTLDGTGSADPDGDALSYDWSLGDGSQGSGPTVSHTYAASGRYTAILTVNDGRGLTATASVPIVVTAPSVGGSKLGVHVVIGGRNGYGDFLRKIRDAGRVLAAVHCVDDFGACLEAKQHEPRTVTVGRLHSHEHIINLYNNPEENAQEFYAAARDLWLAHPFIDYWEAQNEINSDYDWQKRFSLRLMELAEADRLKLALFSSSTGTPARPVDDGGVAYENIKDTALRAMQGGHIMSLHEYGGVPNGRTLRGTEPYHALRYRTLYDYLRQFDAVIPLVITECGQNGGYLYPGVDVFMEDFRWYDGELMKDDYVLGATIFTLGNWAQANFQDALPALGDYIAATGPAAAGR